MTPKVALRGAVLVIAALAPMICPSEAQGFSFSVEPARIELSVPAGKQRGKSVTINNSRSDAPVHIKVYAQDIVFLPDGTNNFQSPGTTEDRKSVV